MNRKITVLNPKNKNIVFIGFMGVGKGTIARALIQKTKRFGLDTDDLIESMENRKIKAIFEADGEAYFRKLEKKTAKWLEKNVKNAIISTGGGFFQSREYGPNWNDCVPSLLI